MNFALDQSSGKTVAAPVTQNAATELNTSIGSWLFKISEEERSTEEEVDYRKYNAEDTEYVGVPEKDLLELRYSFRPGSCAFEVKAENENQPENNVHSGGNKVPDNNYTGVEGHKELENSHDSGDESQDEPELGVCETFSTQKFAEFQALIKP